MSTLQEELQFEVASEDDILENEANIPVHENIASTAEGILEDIMTCRVQGCGRRGSRSATAKVTPKP